MKKHLTLLTFLLLCLNFTAFAGEADVVEVQVKKNNKNSFDFTVTVSHKDTGWDHYANKWEIVDEDGIVLGTRVLHHPHVDEQPFSRSLSDVTIPDSVKKVIVRAHDSVHEIGGKDMSVELP